MVTTEKLQSLTKDELYDLARDRKVPGRSSMDKDELIEALGNGDQERSRSA